MSEDEQKALQHRAALNRAASTRAARRRTLQVLAADAELRAQTSTPEDFAALREHRHAGELLAAAFARYAARPCFGVRATELRGEETHLLPRFETITYGAMWHRTVALATALAEGGWVKRGDLVGLYGPASIDWVATNLACIYLGATSVPLQTSLSPADLEHIARETGLAVIVSSARSARGLESLFRGAAAPGALLLSDEVLQPPAALASLRRDAPGWRTGLRLGSVATLVACGEALPAAPMAVPGRDGVPEQPLVTISYTSGSTGRPKGVVYPDARWLQRMHEALANAPAPHITVNYMSLAQIGGRLGVLLSMVNGGTTYFSPASDLSTLLEDIRLARPTQLILIPRASGLVYQAFQRAMLEAGAALSGPGLLDTPEAQRIMAEMRHSFLGDRLCLVAVGAAPTAPEVIAFLERCFEISVLNAYGATVGTVATNGHVRADVEYKLVDVPELGYSVRDQPYPRGELWVKSRYVAPGYYKQPEAARAFADADGFVPSGDVVEERGARQLAWIDRRNNVLRLAQGEFVSITRVEDALVAGGPLIAQVYAYANPLRAYLLTVVVPNAPALREALLRRGEDASGEVAHKRLLRAEIARIAAAQGLRRHEVPRDFIVEMTPFSRENGLLTESDKPRRPALKQAYGERLEQLYAQIEERQLRDVEALDTTALTIEDKVRRAALAVLGLPEDEELDAGASFVGLGGDSVSAVRLTQVLERACGRAPAVAAVLDPRLPLRALAGRLAPAGDAPTFEAVHGATPRLLRAADLRLDRFLPEAAAARALPLAGPPRTVLLTGANGFLGRSLLLELLQRLGGGRVICIVRANDDAAARARLEAQLGPRGTPLRDAIEAAPGRLVVLAGDLTLSRLGLGATAYDELAAQVDLVVHNGALVNHALSYRALFEPNVLGAVEVMRLCIARRRKPIVFVSSVGVVAGLRRETPAREDEGAAALHPRLPLSDGAEDGYGIGYSASKWAGEVLLGESARVAELPIAIFRCGLLLAHRRYPGQINQADALSRLIFGLARTGVAPPSFYRPGATGNVDGLPVDLVAAAIAATAAAGIDRSATYHAIGEAPATPVSLDRIVEWISSAGIAIVRSDTHDAWVTAFRERLERLDEPSRRRSPLLILQRWRTPADPATAPRIDASAFRTLVRERLPGEAAFVLEEAFVHRWLRDLGAGPEPRS